MEAKSRKDRRKEARQVKRQKRFLSWEQNQTDRKQQQQQKKKIVPAPPAAEDQSKEISDSPGKPILKLAKKKKKNNPKFEEFIDTAEEDDPSVLDSQPEEKSAKKKRKKRKSSSPSVGQPEDEEALPEFTAGKGSRRRPKTGFEEFLELEMSRDAVTAEADLEMERRLAKKLKLKGRKLRKADDGLDELLDEIPSVLDSTLGDTAVEGEVEATQENAEPASSDKKRKKRKSSSHSVEQSEEEEDMVMQQTDVLNEEHRVEPPASDVTVKYVAPHLRARAAVESEEVVQIRRRLRGLLNRLSESNVESITQEIAAIFRSVGRSVGAHVISEEIIAAISGGPRGNEQYAAVFAAFVAGMACLVGIDFSAKFTASVAKSFENEFLKEDGISLRNLTLLLSYLCVFDVCSSDLIYDFLSVLSKRLTEMDVSTILTVLQCCGMKLRGDDPTAMKDFIYSIQNRVTELKSTSLSNTENIMPKINGKRMEFMLETICDIKNNKKRSKEDPVYYTRLKKWLQKLRVEDVLLRGLTWSKLLDPEKKGQWWLSNEVAPTTSNIEEVATTISGEVLEAQKLVQLASAQRMNTDIRRALFCIIMSGEDYIDAFEKILRLDLSGKQDREVTRVLVACCLQEKVFNKYYTVLASKLCSYDKNHKFSLQYCIWDHFKELDKMELIRSMNLARFVAEMLSAFTLSLSLLKTVDLADPTQLTPKRIMHFRMLFEAIFENEDAVVWNIFSRIAGIPELEMLNSSLKFFIKQYIAPANPGKSTAGKIKTAEKALRNVSGVLM